MHKSLWFGVLRFLILLFCTFILLGIFSNGAYTVSNVLIVLFINFVLLGCYNTYRQYLIAKQLTTTDYIKFKRKNRPRVPELKWQGHTCENQIGINKNSLFGLVWLNEKGIHIYFYTLIFCGPVFIAWKNVVSLKRLPIESVSDSYYVRVYLDCSNCELFIPICFMYEKFIPNSVGVSD